MTRTSTGPTVKLKKKHIIKKGMVSMKIVKNVASILMVVCAIICAISLFMAFGYESTLKFAEEVPLSPEQDKIALESFINSSIIAIVCGLMSVLCRYIRNAIAKEMYIKDKMRKRQAMSSVDIFSSTKNKL